MVYGIRTGWLGGIWVNILAGKLARGSFLYIRIFAMNRHDYFSTEAPFGFFGYV